MYLYHSTLGSRVIRKQQIPSCGVGEGGEGAGWVFGVEVGGFESLWFVVCGLGSVVCVFWLLIFGCWLLGGGVSGFRDCQVEV